MYPVTIGMHAGSDHVHDNLATNVRAGINAECEQCGTIRAERYMQIFPDHIHDIVATDLKAYTNEKSYNSCPDSGICPASQSLDMEVNPQMDYKTKMQGLVPIEGYKCVRA